MTQENQSVQDIAETYKQLNDAELHATKLEQMLDNLDAKMDSILQEAETIGNKPVDGVTDNDKPIEDKDKSKSD